MLDLFKTMIDIFKANSWYFILLASGMVCALVVLVGMIKPYIKKIIPNKDLRRSVLGLMSIALSFLAVLIAFWIKDWNLKYYLTTSIAFSVITVFVYWLYECTNCRLGIHKLGSFVLKKLTGAPVNNLSELKEYLKNSEPIIKEEAEVTLKETVKTISATVDNELKNL